MNAKRHALISVTDKNGVVDFARGLVGHGFEILSTGGTAKLLRESGLNVTDVSKFTSHPECLDGRVKTLHPRIHGGLLADRRNTKHLEDMATLGFEAIDVVAVNLYDFQGQARGKDLTLDQTIEYVDIGGPAMLRASAKNHRNVFVVIDPRDYSRVLEALKAHQDSDRLRLELAAKVFQVTAAYDQMICDELTSRIKSESTHSHASNDIPSELNLALNRVQVLRYGENNHQKAALYTMQSEHQGFTAAKILQGKELSYNNLVDLDAAAAIVADFDPLPAVTIIKHANPCGTAARLHASVRELFGAALASDPKCAFGGIVASNLAVDGATAKAMSEIFLECVIAPHFTTEALAVFATKKNLRVVESSVVTRQGHTQPWTARSILGGMLLQTPDDHRITSQNWTCATSAQPTPAMLAEMAFAMTLCRHVKSNAIVLTKDGQSLGVGAGQMSRVDSARIAIEKAKELGHSPCGAVVASDAFFPFRDTVDALAKAGIAGIIQPGGSLRDQESIDAANEHGIVMMMTGVRHFWH